MPRAFLRWIRMCVLGPSSIPQVGEQWLFSTPYKFGYMPVTVTACDGATVWYVFHTGMRSDLDVHKFVAWYRRVA